MTIFQSTTWNAYELWLFKVSVFAIGILVGIYFTDICRSISTVLWFIGGIGTVLTTLLWWGKISKK